MSGNVSGLVHGSGGVALGVANLDRFDMAAEKGIIGTGEADKIKLVGTSILNVEEL